MATQVQIPRVGQNTEKVTILRWLVEDGVFVQKGDDILEIEADKAALTIQAEEKGYLHRGPYQESDEVPPLTVVAVIGASEEPFPIKVEYTETSFTINNVQTGDSVLGNNDSMASIQQGKSHVSPRARRLAKEKGIDLTQVALSGIPGEAITERELDAYLRRRLPATPVARSVAAEANLDLSAVKGTGPRGIITKEDVERAQAAATSKPRTTTGIPPDGVTERIPLRGVRALVSERMAASVHTAARVTLMMEVDGTEMVAMRDGLKRRVEKDWGFVPSYNDILAKICANALRQFPYMNARLTEGMIEYLRDINLGLATDTERGLVVPVIRDADKKSLRELGAEFHLLVERARDGKLLPGDLGGGTFTISNLGMFDVDAFTPIINLPETAILGVGRIAPKPVIFDGQIVVRQMLMLCLAFDHRVVDGAPAARFLKHVKGFIEEPYVWLAEF